MAEARHRGNPPAHHPRGMNARRRWILILLCATFFIAVNDSTIVYTALPSIGGELAMAESLRWVVVAYLLSSGTLLLLGGRSADLFGQRRTFLLGVGLFSAMSLLCGLATSGGVLITARALQGTGAALMVPAALSTLMTTFPEGPSRNRALGIWGSLAGIGATTGLLLGGPITQTLGWRAIFLINVPVGLAALALGPKLLPPDGQRSGRSGTLNLPAAVTAALALLLLTSAIVEVDRASGARTVGLLAAAALLSTLFLRIERHAADPLVPPRLFRSRAVVGGNLIILAAGISVDGLLYTFTIVAQEVLGRSAAWFGLAMTVMTVTSFLGVGLGQHLVSRLGARPVAAVGFALIGFGSLVTRYASSDAELPALLAGLALFGPGLGACFVAGQITALSGVTPGDAGLASGLEETTFAIGNALGVAVASTLILAAPSLHDGTRTALTSTAAVAALGVLAALLHPGARVGVARP
jgi:EmrB/QacA subfamily drug resistance transporter